MLVKCSWGFISRIELLKTIGVDEQSNHSSKAKNMVFNIINNKIKLLCGK